jgi:hypothetical protein
MTDADPSELLAIGYAAAVTYHRTEPAIRAFREAARSGDTNQAPMAPTAAVNLGNLLEDPGDAAGDPAAARQPRRR